MEIGEQIRIIRKGRGYATCAKLAKVMNCSPETIRRIERGEKEPSIDLLKKISKALNYSFVIESENNETRKQEVETITESITEEVVEQEGPDNDIDESGSLDEPFVPES